MSKFFSSSLFIIVSGVLFAVPQLNARSLSADDVVALAFKQGPLLKQADLAATQVISTFESQRGVYDWILTLAPTFEYTEAQNLAGFANPNDRTATILGGISKRTATGSIFSINYQSIQQESELSTFTSNLRRPRAALNALSLRVRQSLWRNFLGEADRASLESVNASIDVAELNRQEAAEAQLVQSLSLFWNAYVSEVQWRENTAARDKYVELVKSVRRKAGYSLSAPGELPRLEAELEASEGRVQLALQENLRAADLLKTNLQLPVAEAIEFRVDLSSAADFPAVPSGSSAGNIGSDGPSALRSVLIAKANLENAVRNRTAVNSNNRPRVDLVAEARSTGVSESTDTAFSNMKSGINPTYSVGVEVEWPLDSSLYRGLRGAAEAGYQVSEVEFRLAQDQARDSLAASERALTAQRANAVAAIAIVNKRTQVLRELETSYRQGRTPLVEMIRAYNELFVAQSDRARAVGQAMIAFSQLSATRDELIPLKRHQ